MKKILCIAATALAVVSSVISCTKDGFQIDDPYINESGCIYMHVGEYYIVNCTEDPWTAKWTSSNREVATVEGGIITAFSPGTAKITVAPKMGKKTSFNVIVEAVPVTDFKIDDAISLYAGRTIYLEVKGISPSNASATSIVWESSDESVFIVKVEEGSVKLLGKSEGTAKLTGSANGVTRTSTVTVKGPKNLSLPASVDAYVNHDVEVSVVQEPEVYTDYKWTLSQDGKICKVRSEGAKAILTGVAPGKCTLELALAGGAIKKECEVTVKIGDLILDKSEHSFFAGDELTLTATQTPEKFSDYEWVSEDATIASVSGSGKTAVVKAGNKSGETVIRCYVNGRGIAASCRIRTIGEDFLEDMRIVLVRPGKEPRYIEKNVYVSPTRTEDSELHICTIYGHELPECFKGKVTWNEGTASQDSFSTTINNQSTYRTFTVTCSTPVGSLSINYVQGFRNLEVREFYYTEFISDDYWFQSGYAWYFTKIYGRLLPEKTATLRPDDGWAMWAIKPNQDFFFTGEDDYMSGINIIERKIETDADGLTDNSGRVKVIFSSVKPPQTIVSQTTGYFVRTCETTTPKTVDGTITVNRQSSNKGQPFKVHCIIQP